MPSDLHDRVPQNRPLTLVPSSLGMVDPRAAQLERGEGCPGHRPEHLTPVSQMRLAGTGLRATRHNKARGQTRQRLHGHVH